jgi:hypothetical protein
MHSTGGRLGPLALAGLVAVGILLTAGGLGVEGAFGSSVAPGGDSGERAPTADSNATATATATTGGAVDGDDRMEGETPIVTSEPRWEPAATPADAANDSERHG